MPEVSLVAILDADKEGFLRSTGSLIQTIGRAARNVRGKAILYGDEITRSMKAAMDETARRREKQVEYNQKHNITPRTIQRRIADIMEGAHGEDVTGRHRRGKTYQTRRVAEPETNYAAMDAKQIAKLLTKLESRMYKHAQDLEFEQAAHVRDEIHTIKEQALR